jgi:hypothetical protein
MSSGKVRFADLEARGWTREIAQLHGLAPRHHWWVLADAIAIEATPSWQAHRDAAAAGEKLSWSKTELIEAGWTDGLIAEHLGDPQLTVNIGRGRVRHIWMADRVADAESNPAWQAAAAKVAASRPARSKASKEAAAVRAEPVLEAAHQAAAELSITVPDGLTLEQARRRSIESAATWLASKGRPLDVAKLTDEQRERMLRNWFRHELTNYDGLLRGLNARFRGIPGVVEMYEGIVRPAADAIVEEAISSLPSR